MANFQISQCLHGRLNSGSPQFRKIIPCDNKKMEIFKMVQGELAVVGIDSSASNRLNFKVTMGFLLFAFSIFSIAKFIFLMENVILMDYMESVNTLSSLALVGFLFVVIILKQIKLLAFIGSMEQLINKSKLFSVCCNNV